MEVRLRDPERIEALNREGLRIIQNPKFPCFSLDALLLSDFASKILRDSLSPRLIGDWGSGTGIIALLIAAYFPECQVRALELMAQMAEMAQRSVVLNDLALRVEVIKGDIRSSPSYFKRDFDAIISNPPYLPLGEGRLSPDYLRAAARSEVECTLEDVIKSAAYHLREGGSLFLCNRPSRFQEAKDLCTANGLNLKAWRLVYPAEGGPSRHFLLQAVKGQAEIDVEEIKPLYIFHKQGVYTKEAWEILSQPLWGRK